jgi:hypothetical protein
MLPERPKANCKINTGKQTRETNTYTKTRTKLGNVYHLDKNNSICAVMPTMMR